MTANELVLTFGGLHLCVKFGENLRIEIEHGLNIVSDYLSTPSLGATYENVWMFFVNVLKGLLLRLFTTAELSALDKRDAFNV